MQELSQRLDLKLDRIQLLLEEGNQHAKDSREEMQQGMEHLKHKVDQVQDTVAYIKKKMTSMTPYRLAALLLCLFLMWLCTLYYILPEKFIRA